MGLPLLPRTARLSVIIEQLKSHSARPDGPSNISRPAPYRISSSQTRTGSRDAILQPENAACCAA